MLKVCYLYFPAGIIKTKANLDYDTMGSTSFRFTISVTDSKDTASATITVNVININEAPSFDHTSYSVSGDEDVVRLKPPPAEQIIF